MLKSKNRCIMLVLFAFLFALVFANNSYAEEAEENILPDVDMSKGVTMDSDGYSYFINLNGNSVIITEGSAENYINMYIDKNRNGIIDAGETKVIINDSEDISGSMNFFGVYKAKSTTPIRITQKSGRLNYTLYGVQSGEINLKDNKETAIDFDLQGGNVNCTYAVYNSVVNGKVSIKGRNITSQAPIFLTGASSKITGDVNLDIDSSEIYSICGVSDSSTVEGDYTYSLGKEVIYEYSNSNYITNNNSAILGNVTASFYGNPTSDSRPYFYGINGYVSGSVNISAGSGYYYNLYGSSNNGNTAINKDFTFNVSGVNTNSTIYGFYGAACLGNLSVTVKDSTFGGFMGAYHYSYSSDSSDVNIKGNVNIDVDETNVWLSSDSMCGVNQFNIEGDCVVNFAATRSPEAYYYNYVTGIQNTVVNGNASVDFDNVTSSYMYGINAGSNGVITGTCDINISNCTNSSDIYGVNYGAYLGKLTINMSNNKETNSNSLYAAYYISHVGKDGINVNIDNCDNYYNVKGVYGYSSTSSDIEGEANVSITNCDYNGTSWYSYIYGIDNIVCQSNSTITIDNSAAYSVYGSNNAQYLKNLDLKITDIDFSSGGKSNNSSSYLYGLNSCMINEELDLDITGLTVNGTYIYGVNSSNLVGDADILIDGMSNIVDEDSEIPRYTVTDPVTINNCSIYPVQTSTTFANFDTSQLNNHITATIKNINVANDNSFSTSISNSLIGMQNFDLIIDESCDICENCNIVPNNNSYSQASANATYKEAIYYSGSAVNEEDLIYNSETGEGYKNVYFKNTNAKLTHNVIAENIYVEGGVLIIPEGITLAANEKGYIYATHSEYNRECIVVEGTLQGRMYPNQNEAADKAYSLGRFVMNGGNIITDDVDYIKYVYYPITIIYNKSAGSIMNTAMYVLSQYANVYFALVGQTDLNFTCTPNVGYTVGEANIKFDGDVVSSVLSLISTDAATGAKKYGFDMKEKPGIINITVLGKQISAVKTVADPVAKLNVEYTQEEPLYDFSNLRIFNDAVVGDIIYEIDESNLLPEGLLLDEGKIYGTPTVAYEEGKKVGFKITGKNGTSTLVYLNIIVSEGNAVQTNNEGRLIVDETNKTVDLVGNSVVIEAYDDDGVSKTAIYLDDNRDGIKDCDVPALVADLSNYTVYGLLNSTGITKPVRITMTGGKINYLYGAYCSTMTYDDTVEDAIKIEVLGGKITRAYGLYGTNANTYKVNGSMYACFETGTVTNIYLSSGASYTGCYYKSGDNSYVYNNYRLKDDIEAKSLNLTSSSITTITEGTKLKADNLTISSNSIVYNYGIIESDNDISNYGLIYMMGGSNIGEVTENYSWTGVYYPITFSTDRENTYMSSVSTGVRSLYNNETETYDYYAMGGAKDKANFYYIQGYDYWYSVNGEEYIKSESNVVEFDMPRKASTLNVSYRPKPISVDTLFKYAIGSTETEYTADSPLYDYTRVIISNDSAEATPIKYELKAGSNLPAGLSLVEGKVVGTASKAVENLEITVIITGHNGAKTELTIPYTITKDNIDVSAFDNITVDSSNIYLNGTSVVIYPSVNGNSNYFNVYLDANHDGFADNNIPLTDSNGNSDFYNKTIYGYTNTDTAFDGDISIYTYGGYLSNIYGVGNKNSYSEDVTVNGNVSIYIKGGSISSYLYGANYAKVTGDVTVHASEGLIGTNVYGAYKSTVDGNLNFKVSDNAVVNSGTNTNVYVTQDSTVGKDVNFDYHTATDKKGFAAFTSTSSYRHFYFYGVNQSTVKGNVNYTIDGNMYVKTYISFVDGSDVTGDLKVEVKSGQISTSTGRLVIDSTVDDVYFNVRDNAKANISVDYLLYSGEVNNVYVNIPNSIVGNAYLTMYYTSSGVVTINGEGIYRNKDSLSIKGKYVINEDANFTNITIAEGSELIIAEGVKVTASSTVTNNGKITNNGSFKANSTITNATNSEIINNGEWVSSYTNTINGVFDNYGNVTFERYSSSDTTARLVINTTGTFINRKNATVSIKCRVSNSGYIANYGEFNQLYSSSSYYYLGTVYSVNKLNLYNTSSYYYTYSNIYYLVDLDYDDSCADVALVDANSVPLTLGEGYQTDNFVKCNNNISVKVSNLAEGLFVKKITYDNSGTETNMSNIFDNENIDYQGSMPLSPTTVKVEFGAEAAETITISPTSTHIEKMQVGVNNTYLYLKNIVTISNDNDASTASVTYSVQSGNSLPEGITLDQKTGRIYGTPKIASSVPQDVIINVKGKNQTVAQFTLTFDAVEKGIPNINSSVYSILSGEKLSTLSLYSMEYGTYEWVDGDTVAEGTAGEIKEYKARFVRTENGANSYDWTKVVGGTYDAETDTVETMIKVRINPLTPEYEVPTELTGYYGKTLGDIDLSPYSNEYGDFVWRSSSSTVLQTISKQQYYLDFIAKSPNYKDVTYIKVQVNVKKYPINEIASFASLEASRGDKLSDILLPEDANGSFSWLSSASAVAIDGETYQVKYVPNDLAHYDYSNLPGWSENYKAVIFDVTVYVFDDQEEQKHIEINGLPTELTADHGISLSKVKLPEKKLSENQELKWYINNVPITNVINVTGQVPCGHFEWENEALVIDTEGSYSTTVKFIADDERYAVVTGIPVTIKVNGQHIPKNKLAIENQVLATTTTDGSYEEVSYCGTCQLELSRETVEVYKASSCSIEKSAYVYSGSEFKPVVTLKDSKGNKLESGIDYTVAYSKNKAVGEGVVTISLMGNYKDTITKKFKINPKVTTIGTPAIASDGITVKWTKNTTGSGYYIYRSVNGAAYTKVKTITSNATVSWKDTGAKTNGNKYQYKIIAYKTVDGKTYQSSYSSVKTIYFLTRPTVTLTNTATGVKVAWGKNAKATGYYVYKSTDGGKTYKKVKTITKNTTVSYTDTAAKANGTKYMYKVEAYKTVSSVTYKSAASAVKTDYFLTRPTVTLTNTATGVKVAWGKNAKATGYYVYKSTDGGKTYKKIKTITKNTTVSYTDTAAKTNGTKYMYKVEAYKTASGTTYKSVASAVKTMYFVSKPSVSSLTNQTGKKMLVKWARNAKASGYQIQYSTSSSFSSPKSVTATGTSSTLSKTISSLTKGKTYYVRIRSYKTVGSTKYYSAWSATKSVKISK